MLFMRYSESRKDKGAKKNIIDFLDLSISSMTDWQKKIYEDNHVSELTPYVLSCIEHEPSPDSIPDKRSPRLIRGGHRNFVCHASFRANGKEINHQGVVFSRQEDAAAYANGRMRPVYDQWLHKKNVIEPYVHENLIVVSAVIIDKLNKARALLLAN